MRTCHILHLGIYDSNNCMLMFPLDMSSTLYFVLHPKLTLSFAFVFSFFFFLHSLSCALPAILLWIIIGCPLSYFLSSLLVYLCLTFLFTYFFFCFFLTLHFVLWFTIVLFIPLSIIIWFLSCILYWLLSDSFPCLAFFHVFYLKYFYISFPNNPNK